MASTAVIRPLPTSRLNPWPWVWLTPYLSSLGADFPATRRPTVRGYTDSANAWLDKSMSSS
jgi:hypothetical protein